MEAGPAGPFLVPLTLSFNPRGGPGSTGREEVEPGVLAQSVELKEGLGATAKGAEWALPGGTDTHLHSVALQCLGGVSASMKVGKFQTLMVYADSSLSSIYNFYCFSSIY